MIWSVGGSSVFSRNAVTRPVGCGGHAAERAGISHAHQVQGDVCLSRAVGVEHRAQVGAAEHVAVEHHDVVPAQCRGHVPDATTGAQRRRLGDVLQVEPELRPVTEVALEHLGLEGGAEHDVGDARRLDAGRAGG